MAEWPGGARSQPAAADRRADLPLPAALPLLLEPDRHRRRRNTSDELPAEDWQRVFREAADLGVLQLALTGGEPMARKEIVELIADLDRGRPLLDPRHLGDAVPEAAGRSAARGRPRPRPDQLPALRPGRSPTRSAARSPSTARSKAAALARELDFPLTVNCVLHRRNIDAVDSIIDDGGGARRAAAGARQHAVPRLGDREPRRADADAGAARARRGGGEGGARAARRRSLEILWVLPDYYEELPKPCMGGWAQRRGARAAERRRAALPGGGLDPRHRDRQRARQARSREIWLESEMFNAFRGTEWMQEPCRSLPARPPARGPRRLPLPGAGADRRRRGDRPGLPVLAAPRDDRRAPRARGRRAGARRAARPFVYRDLIPS